ncbi:NHLP-related RiPP peptide [Arenimonas daejeonensis]|uniref:NHLP-related RiPP peptide n=1 Tax=Arenimonas daejeonensis TaxID=370777 RepID=UPI0011BEE245|nr:NHLP-related RiPP peptide [Arenimonas daejeonensis]
MAKKLSEKTIDALLDMLAGDDEFRARFKANPRAATRSLGTQDEAVESLPEAPITDLADKEAFRKSRAVVRQSLINARDPFEPISLEVPR